jgi:ABC-type Fe3+ transport system, permease component
MLLAASKSAFALPGIIAGLALVLLFNRWVPFIYGTIMMMIIGFALRLLPQAVATNEAALRRVGPSLEQAARVMGCRPVTVFHRVTLPIAAPGIAASWALIFITSMKELPMAIMLRPPGFDTLPVRIWAAASESVHTQAAPAAFLLIVLTLLTLLLLMGRSRVGLDRVLLEHN